MHGWRLGGLGRSWEMHGGINGIERGGSLAVSVVPKQYVKARSRPIKTKSKKSFEVEKHCPWPVGAWSTIGKIFTCAVLAAPKTNLNYFKFCK